ncbi:MAG: long-chain fatty acid--CoA ligase [Planctomycetes bacterium]|nr:long-chain fatty acid--CoA ligase [Planctomycetota bacterium]
MGDMALNLGSIIENSNRYFAAEVALIHDEKRLTYQQLRAEVMAFAAHLRQHGIQPGDKVALFLPNRMSFTIAYFGILYAGAVVVPISYLSVAREVAYTLKDSNAAALVAWSAYATQATEGFQETGACRELLLIDESSGPLTLVNSRPVQKGVSFDLAQTDPDETAVILYTSGTTGQPKGAELTHFNLFSNAQWASERCTWDPRGKWEFVGPGSVYLAALPLFHSFGQTCNQNASLFGGAALTYLERFDPEKALHVMARDRVTHFAGVPTMYFQLLNFPDRDQYDLSSLRYCTSGGAAMPVEVMREFDERYKVNVLEGYGLSETSPVATFNVLWRPKKPGSIGQPIFGVEVKIFDDQDRELNPGEVGEVVIRGPNIMKGYYRRPEATAQAMRSGWFHSGDLGRGDEEGYFYIVDRKKDMIIRGGFNVYPREVEEVLYTHPAVREAAVVGVPNPEYGEEVKAYISFKPGTRAEPQEIVAFCRKNLAASKYPRLVEILDSLPKGPTGKILRKELRSRAS